MSYYDDRWRSKNYFMLADVYGSKRHKYVKVGEKAVHQSPISTVWIAEREMPYHSRIRELCVAKETDRIIEGRKLTRFCNANVSVDVELKDYLRQISFVNHANIVKFFGYGKTALGGGKYRLSLICEYCPGGDLANHLEHRSESLSTVHILAYTKQLLDGLCFLHKLSKTHHEAKNTIHGDIKPKNLFLSDYRHDVGYRTIKIGDHDEPGHMNETSTRSDGANHVRGTQLYMSPELIGWPNNGKVGRKTDCWSLGCVLLRMYLGRKDMQFTRLDIVRNESTFSSLDLSNFVLNKGVPVVPVELDAEVSGIIHGCLVHDQTERPYADELFTLHEMQLLSASRILSTLKESKVGISSAWRDTAEIRLKSLPKRYWRKGYIVFDSNICAYDHEWLYVRDQLRQAAFSGPIRLILCRSAQNWRTLFALLRHLKDFITFIKFRGEPASPAEYGLDDHFFSETVFPSLVSLTVDEFCVISKPDIETVFAVAPNLCELLLHGSSLRYWEESTSTAVPSSLRYMEWRMSSDLSSTVFKERLYQLDTAPELGVLRSFLKQNPRLTTAKSEGSCFRITSMINPPRPFPLPHLLNANYFGLLGKGIISLNPHFYLGSLRDTSLVDGCDCDIRAKPPIQHASCALTACPYSGFCALTITKTVSEEEWSAFWTEVKRRHRSLREPWPFTVLTLEECDWDKQLPRVVLQDISVQVLFVRKCAVIESREWSEWIFNFVTHLIFIDCKKVSFYAGTLNTSFPSLKSIVMDNSTFHFIEKNVFKELPALCHLCLDGSALSRIVQQFQSGVESMDADVRSHLIELHFDSQYEWLRKFLKSHSHLIESRKFGSLILVPGFTLTYL